MKKLLLLSIMLMTASCFGGGGDYNAKPFTPAKYKGASSRPAAVSAEPEKYVFDKDHTTILFYINHLGFSDKIGRFDDYDGYFVLDRANPEKSFVDVTVRPRGINTGSKALDREVQKDGWFNTAKYPTVHFKSTQVKLTGDNTADVTGYLTMLGQEKPVTMRVVFNRSGTHPVNKQQVAGFRADLNIKRTEWGMNNFVPMVGEYVRIQVQAEGYRQKQ